MVAPLEPEASGIGLYSHTLGEALKREGVEFLGLPLRSTDGKGIDKAKPVDFARVIKARAESDRADVVHLQYEPGLLSAGQARALAKNPPENLVVTLHRVPAYDGLWTLAGLRQRKAVWMERSIVKAARLLLVHSDHTLAVVNKRHPNAQCALQPMPVPADDCKAPRKAGNPVLFFGHVHPGKGAVELVRAMRLAPELKCTIAGPEDPKWARLNADLARELSLAPNVTREKGWLSMERKHALFSGCSVVALPYSVGGFGSAVLQDAIAHERPVVAGTVEPLADTVARLGVGRSSSTDPELLAQTIQRVANDNTTPYESALSAARRAQAPAAVAKILIDKYASLLT